MPIAKLKYLVANGDLATGNFAPWSKHFASYQDYLNYKWDLIR
jgi:hypothetical protein